MTDALHEPAVRLCIIAAGTSPGLMSAFMCALMAAEIGGFAMLFAGALRAL